RKRVRGAHCRLARDDQCVASQLLPAAGQVEALQLHIVQPDRQARRELDIPEIRIAGDRRALDHAAITRRTYRPRTRLVKLCTRQLEDGSLDLEAQRARCSDDLPVLVDPGLDGRAGDLLVETPDG